MIMMNFLCKYVLQKIQKIMLHKLRIFFEARPVSLCSSLKNVVMTGFMVEMFHWETKLDSLRNAIMALEKMRGKLTSVNV